MINPFYISSRLAKIKHNETELSEIKAYLNQISGNGTAETAFFEYCKQHKLAPWIKVQLERLNLLHLFSDKVQTQFKAVYEKTKNQNEARNKTAALFLKEFEKAGIDVAILKGNLLIHSTYKDSGYKKMNDFDILVHKKDWLKIQDIYFKLGYIPLGFGWGGEREKPADYSHVGMSFISPDFTCIIGTQWGLKSPTTNFTVDINKAWETSTDFDFYGVKCKQLSPEYNLLHLILHLGIYKCGTRDLMDIFNLILSLNELDEDKLINVLKSANTLEKADFAFQLTQICSNTIPTGLLQKLKSHKQTFISRRLKKRLKNIRESGDIHNSYNDYFQDIEKNVIYFGLFPEFHKKLIFYAKIIKQIYLPHCATALKLTDNFHKPNFINKLNARLTAPYYVFSLLAQEIGWKFTILLYFKLFFDLIISLKNYIFKQESYFDYLKKRNVNPKDIEQIVKGIS